MDMAPSTTLTPTKIVTDAQIEQDSEQVEQWPSLVVPYIPLMSLLALLIILGNILIFWGVFKLS